MENSDGLTLLSGECRLLQHKEKKSDMKYEHISEQKTPGVRSMRDLWQQTTYILQARQSSILHECRKSQNKKEKGARKFSTVTIVNHAQHLEMLRIPIMIQRIVVFFFFPPSSSTITATIILHSIVKLSDVAWQIL